MREREAGVQLDGTPEGPLGLRESPALQMPTALFLLHQGFRVPRSSALLRQRREGLILQAQHASGDRLGEGQRVRGFVHSLHRPPDGPTRPPSTPRANVEDGRLHPGGVAPDLGCHRDEGGDPQVARHLEGDLQPGDCRTA